MYPLVHVPLIVKYPRRARIGVEDRPVSLVDVAPTVLAVLGVPPLGATQTPLWERGGPAVAETVGVDAVTRAVYDGEGHELLETVTPGRRDTRLYDLRRDPLEEHPLEVSADSVAVRLGEELHRLVSALPRLTPGPVVFPEADAQLAERLRRLGYVR